MSPVISILVKFLTFLKREAPRTFVHALGIALLIWLSDWLPKDSGHPEFAPLLTCSYMILLLVAVAHFIRRVLFHKLDLQKIAIQAIDEKNFPAAIVFLSIILVLISAMFVLAGMLR